MKNKTKNVLITLMLLLNLVPGKRDILQAQQRKTLNVAFKKGNGLMAKASSRRLFTAPTVTLRRKNRHTSTRLLT
ncbi:MAG: hypothetical protein WKF91_22825 [Segetibacter sp.]